LEGDGELVVIEVFTCLPQALMLCLHGGLTSTEVDSAGCELAAHTFELVDDLFFLLLLFPLPLYHLLLLLGDNVHTPAEILLQLGTGIGTDFVLGMSFLGLL
jgi:hypothetical protein